MSVNVVKCGLDKPNNGPAGEPPQYTPGPGPRSEPLSKIDSTSAPRACSVFGCGRPASRRDLCAAHYRRLLDTGDVGGPAVRGYSNPACSVSGCDRPHKARSFCTGHYRRFMRDGEPGAAEFKPVSAPLAVPRDVATLAYLAGLMDGEGTITRKAEYGYWVVKIAMMDGEVIEYLSSLMGGTVSSHHRTIRERREHEWYVGRQLDVFRFLVAVLPYMRVNAKRSKAMLAIDEIAANPMIMEALNG